MAEFRRLVYFARRGSIAYAKLTDAPLAAYNVSGEYLRGDKRRRLRGWLDEAVDRPRESARDGPGRRRERRHPPLPQRRGAGRRAALERRGRTSTRIDGARRAYRAGRYKLNTCKARRFARSGGYTTRAAIRRGGRVSSRTQTTGKRYVTSVYRGPGLSFLGHAHPDVLRAYHGARCSAPRIGTSFGGAVRAGDRELKPNISL